MRAPPPARAASSASSSSSSAGAAGLAGEQALEVVGRAAHVRDVEVRALLEADVDERGLHPGQHAFDASLVDVPRDAALALALDVELTEVPVLNERDPGLGTVGVDYEEAAMGHPDAKLTAQRGSEEPRAVGAHADANVRVHRETSIGRRPVVTRNYRQINDIADFEHLRHTPCSDAPSEAPDRVSTRFALPSSP